MLNKRKTLVYIVAALLVLVVLYALYIYRAKIGRVFIPFFMAMIIAYLLHPLVTRLERKKISRTKGIILIYLLFSILMVTITIFIIPELINNTKDLMNTIPDLTTRYQLKFNNIIMAIQSSKWSPDIKSAIYREIQNGASFAQNYVLDILRKSLSALLSGIKVMFDLVLAMIIAYYFIKDAKYFKEVALSFTPRKWRNGLITTGREINLILSNFIQGQLITALIVGLLETVGLMIINIKYPLILGVVGGVANIIPFFGPIIGGIPAVAVALLDSPAKTIWTVVVFTIVQQIDNAFISPKIIEGRLGLHPVTTMLAVLVGGEFFGIIGMLLSVPIAAIVKIIIKRSIDAIV
jgi:predicted PurR-regulated permease PerM